MSSEMDIVDEMEIGDNAEDGACVAQEDTPAVAIARLREALWLREVLMSLAPQCRLVQREPGNVLARFLFSSMLTRKGVAWEDPLLPMHDSCDVSLCSELQKTGMDEKHSRATCMALSMASREAAVRVQAARQNEAAAAASSASFAALSATVYLLQAEWKNQVVWQNETTGISAPHLYTLRRLYEVHALDDFDYRYFNRRLFCCLKRYEALGGPTYQCSVTSVTFLALEAEFGAAKECFASPFNHNATVYWSAFPDTDCFFGSNGDFFRSLDSRLVQAGGFFYANPPFVEEYLERLKDAVGQVLELPVAVTFAVVLPTWADTRCYAWMQRSIYTRLHLVLAAGEHEYVDGRQQIDTTRWRKRHVSPFSSSVFILQNEEGSAASPVNDDVRRRVLMSFARRVSRE
jgi:hypothetical protein